MDVKTIAVIGAGIMGSGIAQVASEAGYNVILFDSEEKIYIKEKTSLQRIYLDKLRKGSIQRKKYEQYYHILSIRLKLIKYLKLILLSKQLLKRWKSRKRYMNN